jgi:nickel transport protein
VSALLAPASLAQAHELWLDREAGAYVLYQGHRSGAHVGEEHVPYGRGFVRTARCADEQGSQHPLSVVGEYPVRLLGDCAAVLLEVSSGYWTKTAWETRAVPKTGIAGVLRSWRADEVVKRIDRWSGTLALTLSAGLELSPLENPLTLKPGDKLRLRVSYQGKPRAQVPVAYDGHTRGASGEDGVVVLSLRRGGLQSLSASIELPLADGLADTLLLASTLNFVLPAQ